jgi:hypothetical protein
MDPGTALVAIIGTLGAFATPIALMYMWIHRPSAKRDLGQRPAEAALEARLERIEVAVQAIALETERIAEGQRFTTKWLTAAPQRTPAHVSADADRFGA